MKQIALTMTFMTCSLPSMANTFMGLEMEYALQFMALLLSFGLPLFIILIVFGFNYKKQKAKYKLASQALASGQAIPKELFQKQSQSEQNINILSKGIKNVFLGIGIAIMLWCFTGNLGLTSIGALISCIGLGQIAVAYATRNKTTNKSTDIEQ